MERQIDRNMEVFSNNVRRIVKLSETGRFLATTCEESGMLLTTSVVSVLGLYVESRCFPFERCPTKVAQESQCTRALIVPRERGPWMYTQYTHVQDKNEHKAQIPDKFATRR